MPRRVEVVEYNLNWPAAFKVETEILSNLLGEELITIHHIGSTSIPNLPAKPIIDIMPVVKAISNVDKFDQEFIRLGYLPMGEYGMPNRRFFIKGTFENRTHHVHVFQEGDENIKRHLEFRDFMIKNPDKAKEYGDLKLKLAKEFEYDIEGYINGKEVFIKEIDRRISEGLGK